MPEVRFLGGVLGVVAVLIGVIGLTHHREIALLRLRDMIALAVGLSLLALAVFPRIFDSFAAVLGISSLEGRRVAILTLLGLTVLAGLLFVAVGRVGTLEREVGTLAVELASRIPVFERRATYPERFVAVVIPAYNEEQALPSVLDAMPNSVDALPVVSIVVSDGSTDGTVAAAVEAADVVLERPLRRGSGAAIRTGMAFALWRGATVLVTLDADGQHDPIEIAALARPVIAGDIDLCQGTRIANSKEVSGHAARAMGVSVFAWLMRVGGVAETSDPSNGFRSISSDAYRMLELTEDQFYVGEFIVRSSRADLRIAEVPVTVSARSHGETKKPGTVLYGLGFMRGIIRALVRPGSRSPDR